MTKKPGIRILVKLKKKIDKINKPNAQRVVISDAQNQGFKREAETSDSFDYTSFDSNEEMGLEDTPVEKIVFNDKEKRSEKKQDKKYIEKPVSNMPGFDKSFKTRTARYKKQRKGFFNIFNGLLSLIKFKSTKSNGAALEFAGGGKRLTKREKRNRNIYIYGGVGLGLIAAVLFIVFLSGGAVASANNQTSVSDSGSNTVNNLTTDTVSQTSQSTESSPTITATETLTPSPTTPIPTTAPDQSLVPFDINKEVQTYQVKATKTDPYYNKVGYSNNHYKYTDNEKYMLAQVMQGEAGNSLEGMIAVGNVIMNRVFSRTWPNTITAVVTAPRQFTGYNSGRVPSSQAKYAASLVLDKEDWVVPQNTYFFIANWPAGQDWHGKYYKNIGGNSFFTNSKYGRSSKVPPKLFERTFQWPTYGCEPELRVYKIQYMLNKLGYNVEADKYYGQTTIDALKAFQKDHKFKTIDGVAGPATIKSLINAFNDKFGVETYYNKFCV